jgi:hypothetical protein
MTSEQNHMYSERVIHHATCNCQIEVMQVDQVFQTDSHGGGMCVHAAFEEHLLMMVPQDYTSVDGTGRRLPDLVSAVT